MREILVIRFGSLGDLCVLGWALSRLADTCAPGTFRVTLVTKAAFAPLMSEMRGIDEVVALGGSDVAAVWRVAAGLRKRRWDVVIDAHNVLRSHLLLGLLGRRPDARLAKDTTARLGFMAFGRQAASLDLRMRDRFDQLTAVVPTTGEADAVPHRPPLTHLDSPHETNTETIVGLAPGAQWDTKRWPERHYAELLALLRAQIGGPVRVYLGPREQSWYPGSPLDEAVTRDDQVQVVQEPDLVTVARDLATCDLVVTNDSGLLHVAEAVGTPVLAFFGPTVREFGYFPLLPGSRVLENDASCRPCSRNGKRPCHRDHLACLEDIPVPTALSLVQELLSKGQPS